MSDTSAANNNGLQPSSSSKGQNTEGVEGQQQNQDLSSSSYSDIIDQPLLTTREAALERLSKLQTMKDSLLEEKKRNDSYMKRYTDKVAKCERMATLHNLIPRQLFVREDAYQRELEKVSQWSGISDQEIADIYKRKLSDASNSNSKFKHHGAASTYNKDPYVGFRDVPDFSKVNGKSSFSSSGSSSYNTNNVLRNLEFMKKIAYGGSDIGAASNN
jgi:hypothetical protein